MRICTTCFNPWTIKYIYLRFYKYSLIFGVFYATFCSFPKLGANSLHFKLNFRAKPTFFLPSKCTIFLLSNKSTHQNYRYFFKKFEIKCYFQELMKLRLLVKRLNANSFETEDNHKSGDHEKFCFWWFWRFVTRALSHRQPNTYINVFRIFFGFCNC